jgi:hypothetical protein
LEDGVNSPGALHHLDHLNYAWEAGAMIAEVLSIVGYGYVQQTRVALGWC